MELTNEFTVHLPPDQAWDILTDLPRMTALLPGARLVEVDGELHKGEMKVRVGPLTPSYQGEVRFVERDPKARRAVLRAEGHDARQGPVTATITATLHPAVTGTRVLLATDLSVAGKVAQFGRSVLADISVKLTDEFAGRLGSDLQPEIEAAAAVALTPVTGDVAAAAVPLTPVTDDAAAVPAAPGTDDAAAAAVVADWAPSSPDAKAEPWLAPQSDVVHQRPERAVAGVEAAEVPASSPAQVNKLLAPIAVGAAVLALLVLRRLRR